MVYTQLLDYYTSVYVFLPWSCCACVCMCMYVRKKNFSVVFWLRTEMMIRWKRYILYHRVYYSLFCINIFVLRCVCDQFVSDLFIICDRIFTSIKKNLVLYKRIFESTESILDCFWRSTNSSNFSTVIQGNCNSNFVFVYYSFCFCFFLLLKLKVCVDWKSVVILFKRAKTIILNNTISHSTWNTNNKWPFLYSSMLYLKLHA